MRRVLAILLLGLAASLAAPTALAQQRGPADRTVPSDPVYRSGELILTVDNAFDEPDDNPGDGICATSLSDCTLRAAINEANAQPDQQPVDIEFDISVGPTGAEIAPGVWRIQPNFDRGSGAFGVLPVLSQPGLRIDGITQPGASCGDLVGGVKHDLRVVLDGSLLPGVAPGLITAQFAPNFIVRGLVVQNFRGIGLSLFDNGSLAECNYVGTDYTGEFDRGNGGGIYYAEVVRNNLISGNSDHGIVTRVPSTGPWTVSRNLIGSDADGNQPLGNGGQGVSTSSSDGLITTNLVSANEGAGIGVFECERVVLTNNTVGLTRLRGNGSGGMGNGGVGIHVASGDGVDLSTDIDIGLPGTGQGNFVGNNGSSGIIVEGQNTSDVRIRGNTVGLTFGGAAAPNGSFGVVVGTFLTVQSGALGAEAEPPRQRSSPGGGPFNIAVGGLAPGEGNVVSGNTLSGIALSGDSGTHVEGNRIGLNASGTARPNGPVGDHLLNSGIEVNFSFDPVIVGNTISGNNGSGIRFAFNQRGDSGPHSNGGLLIADNFIGTTDDGSATRPNVESGLVLTNGADFATVTGNTISGNTDTGVFLSQNVTGVVLEDNFIGTNANGDNLGNGLPGGDGRAGILCLNATEVVASQNTIRFNGRDGVFVGSSCANVELRRNSTSGNGGLGIDLAPNNPNPITVGSTRNRPEILSAENDGANATITVRLEAGAVLFGRYRIELFTSLTPDPSGFGEGRTYRTIVETDEISFDQTVVLTTTHPASLFPAGRWVTATSTASNGFDLFQTSELSNAFQVEDTSMPGTITIDATPTSPLTVPRGGQVSFTYTVANGTANPATGQSWFSAALGGNTVAQGVITDGTLPAGQSVNINYTQNVPNNAPIASYDFCLRIGLFPSPFIDQECFVVTVTAAPPVTDGAEAWSAADISPWAPEVMESIADGAEAEEAEAASSTALPETVELSGAYPNPFSARATVAFAVPEAGRVVLAVYDVLGREVARLVDGDLEAGRHAAVLDGAGLPSGVYLVRLVADGQTETQPITLLR